MSKGLTISCLVAVAIAIARTLGAVTIEVAVERRESLAEDVGLRDRDGGDREGNSQDGEDLLGKHCG